LISWALLTLPLLALLTIVFWDYPSVVFVLFWWLKPLFERLPLHILSRALFGEALTIRQALTAYPSLLKTQLLASLLWRRFTPKRSFLLPIQQLEGLSGAARHARVRVLTQHNTQAAFWLTMVGAHIEMALYIGLLGLIYLFIPSQIVEQLDWFKLIDVETHNLLWIEHLTNLLYALVLLAWEPVYVACGFSLYLNRRTELEAWDIELTFRRLRQRLAGVTHMLLLAGCTALFCMPYASVMADAASTPAICPLPPLEEVGPNMPHLLNQPLNSEVSRQHINIILSTPPFKNEKSSLEWHFGRSQDETSAPRSGIQWADMGSLIFHAAHLIEVLLWALLALGVVTVTWRYRVWLSLFTQRLSPKRAPIEVSPHQLLGMEIKPESLPADIPAEAERLWDEHPREALGLLYRGLLSRLLHDFHVPLREAHTEGEILELSHARASADVVNYLHDITRHWQNLAYGHRLPSQEAMQTLCHQWRTLFARQVPA
jgi:hypothetical protein